MSGVRGMRPDYKRREIAIYEKAAEDYDKATGATLDSVRMQSRLITQVSSQIQNPTVLDLGVGTGRYFKAITEAKRIVGIDLSPDMLQKAKLKTRGNNIDLIRADLHALPFPNNRPLFNFIMSIGTLGVHSPITSALLMNLRGLIDDSGVVLLLTNTTREHWKAIARRKVHDLFHLQPGRSFPYQPYAESATILCWKMRKAGFSVTTETKMFLSETLVAVGKPSSRPPLTRD